MSQPRSTHNQHYVYSCNWKEVVLAVPSPPSHVKGTGLPAVTEVGGRVVKPSFLVCATAATARDAQIKRDFAKYMLMVLGFGKRINV